MALSTLCQLPTTVAMTVGIVSDKMYLSLLYLTHLQFRLRESIISAQGLPFEPLRRCSGLVARVNEPARFVSLQCERSTLRIAGQRQTYSDREYLKRETSQNKTW